MALALLSGCSKSGGGKEEKAVAMKDMEVVDGTATDAMTDLDGVQSDAQAVPPAAGASKSAPAATGNSTAAAGADEDVVVGQ